MSKDVKNVKLSIWSWRSKTRPRKKGRSWEEADEEGDEEEKEGEEEEKEGEEEEREEEEEEEEDDKVEEET